VTKSRVSKSSPPASSASPSRHSVQIYEDDSFLLQDLSKFIGATLVARDAAIVIATPAHRDLLRAGLQTGGLDLTKIVEQGRLVFLDARETLDKFMVNGQPDPDLFHQVVGSAVSRLAAKLECPDRFVAAFGEMVALLWSEGKREAAIQLEKLWNQLAENLPFNLHCAYPLALFPNAGDLEGLERICAEHDSITPAERYTALQNDQDRLRTITLLQQKAQALETEIRERDKVQKALQQREAELRDFLENGILPMHWIDAEAKVIWANQAELDLLGYTRDEYIGRPITDFHVDQEAIHDILDRLGRREELRGYKARLRRKDGSLRTVRIYSNACCDGDQFLHTRCFTVDVTERERSEQRVAAQLAITKLLTEDRSASDVTGSVLEAICRLFECNVAAVWQLDEVTGEMYCARFWHKSDCDVDAFERASVSYRFQCGEGLPGTVWNTQQPAWISDLQSETNFPRKTAACDCKLRSAFAFPISMKSKVVGVLEFFCSENRDADDELLTMMAGVGIQMGHLSERRTVEEVRNKLAAIVESSDDAIVSKDLNGIINSWNKSAEKIFGYKAEEVIGRSILVLIPPELHPDETMILSKIRSGQRIEHFQTVRVRKDGVRIDVSLSISPIKNEQGQIIGAAKIARDITAQKKAEQAALQLAAIVESSDDAIVSKDLTGTVTSWNKAAERIFGYTADEMVGRPITTIIPPELHCDEPVILSRIQSGERIQHFETVRLTKDGRLIDVSLTISPVRDHTGRIIGAAKIARDISQQKKLENALHVSERLASVGRLAATVAHEINNPLEAVTNYVYLAKRQPELSELTRGFLDIADRELIRVAHIAQQTLGFYRDNSRPTRLLLSDVIKDVVTIYERKITYKGLIIQHQVEPDLATWAFKGELKQVLSNLLANAIDASREGGRIVIRARRSRDHRFGNWGLRITVADNGTGIAQQDKPRIFAPFFTRNKEVGTGLGLWITRDLLERRGGSIHFRSTTSNPSGTVMSIYVPAAPDVNTENFHVA
jgi:PAS domain S-box-containing protein